MEFCRREKNRAYIVTAVERTRHTIVGWAVCAERTLEILQSVIDSAPPAENYYTDGFLIYQDLSYWGNHQMLKDKSQTYSVEGGNADLRHYLARLGRSSRCFSRCFKALARAVELFVYFYNERQLKKRCYPKYPAYLAQNLPTLI
ncbi:MAG: IS1 family transposase [Acidobacteria bacterium]|nr:IS1 family transposase [Acidobacteriota bacterium]